MANYGPEMAEQPGMTSAATLLSGSVAGRIEQVSGIRPVTLLIAFGIVLVTAIVMATGLAANGLRQQALATAESELGRIDSVLAAAVNRSLTAADAELAEIAARVESGDAAPFRDGAAQPPITELLRNKISHS